jgi:outer membrane protein assembly factor BamB
MKSLFLIFTTLLVTSCSFDNKTGIWRDASKIVLENQNTNLSESGQTQRRLEDVFTKNKIFNEEKDSLTTFEFDLDLPKRLESWTEKYANLNNNVSNILYRGDKIFISKTSKLSKTSKNKDSIFYNNNLISYDHKGKIFVYSLDQNKKIFEYNFYKKKFKKIEKEIFLIMDSDILYVADNLGYVYAINLKNKSLIWAKNYGIPFRSNLKFFGGQLFLANQDNTVYSINPLNGEKNWQFATSLTFLKTDFKNNFAIDKVSNNLFFLNTSGELYSINFINQKINWVINFKNSSLSSDTGLFLSLPIVLKNKNLIIVTENAILNIDFETSSRNWSFPSKIILKPILTSNYTYVVAKNNLLICLDNVTGQVIWSKNIFKSLLKEKKNIKKNWQISRF